MTNVTIPGSVTIIGVSAFEDCSGLVEVKACANLAADAGVPLNLQHG